VAPIQLAATASDDANDVLALGYNSANRTYPYNIVRIYQSGDGKLATEVVGAIDTIQSSVTITAMALSHSNVLTLSTSEGLAVCHEWSGTIHFLSFVVHF
jgi:hypothetical protein